MNIKFHGDLHLWDKETIEVHLSAAEVHRDKVPIVYLYRGDDAWTYLYDNKQKDVIFWSYLSYEAGNLTKERVNEIASKVFNAAYFGVVELASDVEIHMVAHKENPEDGIFVGPMYRVENGVTRSLWP